MLELQMPSLIVLLGPAAEREMAFRQELGQRLPAGGISLARVFVPTGDNVSQAIELTRVLDRVISRSSLAEAHEHGTTAGRALRIVVVGDHSCARQMKLLTKVVHEASSRRGIGVVSYAIVVDLDDNTKSMTDHWASTEDEVGHLLDRGNDPAPLLTYVFYVSTRDQRGRSVTASAAWAQVVSFAAWAICPAAAETIDQLLASNTGTGSPRLGSFGLVRYVSDREAFSHNVGQDIAAALRRTIGRDGATSDGVAEAVCRSVEEGLRNAWEFGNSLEEVIDSALRSLAQGGICTGRCVDDVLRSACRTLTALDWPAEAHCRELEGEIVRLRLEKRFMKPPTRPAPPPQGWFSAFLYWLLPFWFRPPPPPEPPPDPRVELQRRLSAREQELAEVHRQRQVLQSLTARMDERATRLRELRPQPGGVETSREQEDSPTVVLRNVYAWHEFQPTSDEARMDAVVREFAADRLPLLLDGGDLTEEATEFARQHLGDDAQPPPDTFLAACVEAVPSLAALLLDESAPLWPARTHEIASHATIAALPAGDDSALAPIMRQAGVTIIAVNRPEVWFISLACSGGSRLPERVW